MSDAAQPICRYCRMPVTRKPGAPRECRKAAECRKRLAHTLESCVQERPEMLAMFGTWDPGQVMLRVEGWRDTLVFVLERANLVERRFPVSGDCAPYMTALDSVAAAARQALEGRNEAE